MRNPAALRVDLNSRASGLHLKQLGGCTTLRLSMILEWLEERRHRLRR